MQFLKPVVKQAIAEGKSFWDAGQYDATVKRIENGKKSCDDLIHMVKERAEVEYRYAEKLQEWADKWRSAVQKGPEYGELAEAWLDVFTESMTMAKAHVAVSQALSKEGSVLKPLYSFRNSAYHKLALGNIREAKECRETFEKIQLPYLKALGSLAKAKQEYFKKAEHRAKLQQQANEPPPDAVRDTHWTQALRHARGGGASSGGGRSGSSHPASTASDRSDDTRKAKLEAAQKSLNRSRLAYAETLEYFKREVKNRYVTDMKNQFNQCQELERARLTLMLNQLLEFVNAVNIVDKVKQPLLGVYSAACARAIRSQPEKNLSGWAIMYGSAMPFPCPEFEEWNGAVAAENAKKERALAQLPVKLGNTRSAGSPANDVRQHAPGRHDVGGSLTSTSSPTRPKSESVAHLRWLQTSDDSLKGHGMRRASSYTENARQSLMLKLKDAVSTASKAKSLDPNATRSSDGNDGQAPSPGAAAPETPGQAADASTLNRMYVRAVKDHAPATGAELALKAGDIVYQLRGDGNGWCYGRIASKEGRYPSNVVEIMKMNFR